MKKIIIMLWISLFSLGIAKIANANSQEVGSIIGGIAGGILGNNMGHGHGRTVTTIGGAVVGSMVGGQVGQSMDQSYYAYPQYSQWHRDRYYQDCSPRYHHTFIGQNGRLCRHFAYRDEYGDKIYGTACCFRMSNSGQCLSWHVIS